MKRSTVVALFGGTIAVVLVIVPSVVVAADWWEMYRHDLDHTGYSTSAGPETNDVLWTYGTNGLLFSSPSVCDGRVFVGSSDNYVYCLNSCEQDLVWKFHAKGDVSSSPAVADGYVYVGSDDSTTTSKGHVYCLPFNDPNNNHIIESSEVVWQRQVGGQVVSSPAVYNDKVYVGCGNGTVYCLRSDNGNQVWATDIGGSNAIFSSPAINVSSGKVYIGCCDNNVYCLDADNGDEIWLFETGDYVLSSPTLYESFVIVGSLDDTVYCLPQDDPNGDGTIEPGDVIWTYDAGTSVESSPAVYDGKVYVGSKHSGGKLHCIDAGNGTRVWADSSVGSIPHDPAVADGKVYITSISVIYCFDASNGSFIWSYSSGQSVYSSPTIADGVAFAGMGDSVFAFASDCGGAGVDEVESGSATYFRLAQNTPNPFGPSTEIRYVLPVDCHVKLQVYSVAGRRVATLVDEYQHSGLNLASWNARDEAGSPVSSGIYFCRLEAGGFSAIRKMVLAR
jgi:outer membrane protein assembly factor BamB